MPGRGYVQEMISSPQRHEPAGLTGCIATAKACFTRSLLLAPQAQPLRWAGQQSTPIEWAGRSVALFEPGAPGNSTAGSARAGRLTSRRPGSFYLAAQPRPRHITQSTALGASAPLTSLLTTGVPPGLELDPPWRSRLLFEWAVGGCTSLRFWTAAQPPIASLESHSELRAPPGRRCSSYGSRVSGSDSDWLD